MLSSKAKLNNWLPNSSNNLAFFYEPNSKILVLYKDGNILSRARDNGSFKILLVTLVASKYLNHL